MLVQGLSDPTGKPPVTTKSQSLGTALPVGALRERLHHQSLHHARGHDPALALDHALGTDHRFGERDVLHPSGTKGIISYDYSAIE